MRNLFIACLSLAYLSLLPQFYLIFDAANRAYLLWDRPYHAAIISALFILGLIYFLLAMTARILKQKWPRTVCWLTCCFILFVTIRTIVSLIMRTHVLPEAIEDLLGSGYVKIIYYTLSPVLLASINPIRISNVLRSALLVLSPLVLFLIFVPLTYATFSRSNMTELQNVVNKHDILTDVTDPTADGAPSVFIFIFDEWSYDRCFGKGVPQSAMPQTRLLMRESLVFKQARSAGASTFSSIPRMLLPGNSTVQNSSFRKLKSLLMRRKLRSNNDSLFRLAPTNYRKVISGCHLDYERILTQETDYIRAYNGSEGVSRTFLGETFRLLRTQTDWLRYVGIKQPPPTSCQWYLAQVLIHQDAMFVVENFKRPIMAIFHYLLPHFPFAWDGNGLKADDIKNLSASDLAGTPENYMDNVAYLDRVIGELIGALRKHKKSQYMIVLTSDHAWRMDPDHATWRGLEGYPYEKIDLQPDSPFRHVPLIIHTARPNDIGIVESEFNLADLHLLVARYLANKQLVDQELITPHTP